MDKVPCKVCQKLILKKNIAAHKRTHKPVRQLLECVVCSKAFLWQHHLWRHMRLHADEQKLFYCATIGCSYATDRHENLRRHQATCASLNIKPEPVVSAPETSLTPSPENTAPKVEPMESSGLPSKENQAAPGKAEPREERQTQPEAQSQTTGPERMPLREIRNIQANNDKFQECSSQK